MVDAQPFKVAAKL